MDAICLNFQNDEINMLLNSKFKNLILEKLEEYEDLKKMLEYEKREARGEVEYLSYDDFIKELDLDV